MPRYKVTMPDGRTYSIEGPAGATKEQVIAAVQRRIGGAQPDTTLGGELKEVVKGVIPGAVSSTEDIITGAAALLSDEQEAAVRAKAAEIAGAVREPFKAAPGYEQSTGRKFGEALGSIGPYYAVGRIPVVGLPATVAMGVAAGAGQARERAEQEGGEEQKTLATLGGAAIGATEALPVFNFVKRLPPQTQLTIYNRIRRAFEAGGQEGAQEMAAQIGQNFIAQGLYKPEQALIEGAGEEGAYGAGVGAFIQVLTDMALGRRAGPTAPPPTAEEKLAEPETPPTAPPGTRAAAEEDVARQVDTEATVRDALDEEALAIEEARLEREAIQAYNLTDEGIAALEAELAAEQKQGARARAPTVYDEEVLREAAEAERLAPVEEDVPYMPPARAEALGEVVSPAMAEEVEDAAVRAGDIEAVDAGAVGRGDVLPPSRPVSAGQPVAEPTVTAVEPASGPAADVVAGEGVEPTALDLRNQAINYIQDTGKGSAVALQKALGIKLSEAKVLREALLGSGAVTQKGNLYTVTEELRTQPTAPPRVERLAERVEDAEAAPTPGLTPYVEPRAAAPAPEVETAAAPRVPTPALPERQVKKAAEAIVSRRIQPGLGLEETGGVAPEAPVSVKPLGRREVLQEAKQLYDAGKVSNRIYRSVLEDLSTAPMGGLKQRDLAKIRNRLRASQQRIEASQAAPVEQAQIEPAAPAGVDEEIAQFYARREAEDVRQRRQRGEREIGMRFERGTGMGLSADRVDSIAKAASANWKNKPRIFVVQSVNDLPDTLRDKVPGDAKGFYVRGDVFIIADNASSEASVRSTLFHESLGHFGLKSLFDRRLSEVMSDIYRTNLAMRKAADKWLNNNPDTYNTRSAEEQNAMAVEEVLAEASSQGPIKDNGIRAAFNRVAALIRRFLRGMGIQVNYSNNDIRQILIEAHGAVTTRERESRLGKDGDPMFQRKEAKERLSKVFDVNLTAPKYDNKIGDGVRGALSNVQDSLREGALAFLSIPQIAEVWEKELPAVAKLDVLLGRRGATEMKRREKVSANVTSWFKLANDYKDSPQVLDKFFQVANMTTIYQVDPLSDSVQALTKKPTKDIKSPADKVAYDIVTEYNKLPADLRKAYKDMREDYDASSKEFEYLLEQRLGKDALDRIKNKYDQKKLQVYLPLWRSGNYWMTYTDKNGEVISSAYASDIDRQRAKEAAIKEGGKDIQEFSRLREAREGAPPTGFLGDVVKELEAKGVPPDALDAVYEAYLNYLPAESIRQMRRPRESSFDLTTGVDRYGVFGFEPDIFQAYANVAPRIANQLTNLQYAIPLEETMRELYQQSGGERARNPVHAAVYRNLQKQVNFIRNPQPNWWADGASYFSYLWFIAGNISSALINTTQLPLVVAPLLGGKYGVTKSLAAMDKALEMYFNGGWDNNNKGKKAFPSDFTFGEADNLPRRYKNLYRAAVERSIIRRSTGYEITEAQRTGVKDFVGTRARVEHGLGWLFQNSERFNREITLLAAFDLAYEKTKDESKAIEEALKLVTTAHGTALAETGPRLFQQGIGKVMFTFKRFAQAQVYLLSRLFNQAFRDADPTTREIARSQIIGIFGSAFLISGLQGMPMYGLVEFLANRLMGDDDEPYDFSAYVNEKFKELGYKGLLNQMIGVDIASRTGFNGLIWRDDSKRMAEIGPFLYTLERAMGPAYSIVTNAERGIKLFFEGEYLRAIEAIPPLFISNATKAIRMVMEEGVKNKDGTPVVEDVSKYNLLMQAVGFRPTELAAARERAGVRSKITDKLIKRRDSLLDDYYSAWQEKDRRGMQEILDKIRRFNSKNPQRGLAITPETIQKSIMGRQRKQALSVDGLYTNPTYMQRVNELSGQ